MVTDQFIGSNEYLSLTQNLQNILLFSFACRLLSKERWNELKNNIYIQFNKPKINIFKSGKNLIKDFFLRLKTK